MDKLDEYIHPIYPWMSGAGDLPSFQHCSGCTVKMEKLVKQAIPKRFCQSFREIIMTQKRVSSADIESNISSIFTSVATLDKLAEGSFQSSYNISHNIHHNISHTISHNISHNIYHDISQKNSHNILKIFPDSYHSVSGCNTWQTC